MNERGKEGRTHEQDIHSSLSHLRLSLSIIHSMEWNIFLDHISPFLPILLYEKYEEERESMNQNLFTPKHTLGNNFCPPSLFTRWKVMNTITYLPSLLYSSLGSIFILIHISIYTYIAIRFSVCDVSMPMYRHDS